MLPVLVVAATMPMLMQGAPSRTSASEVGASLSKKDSSRVLKAARRAQGDFESLRRRLLPRQSGLAGRACDAVIGRFCHWQSNGDGPPPESPKVVSAREKLIVTLDSLGRVLPDNRWILAQRARYRIEANRHFEAEQMARECVARTPVTETRGWCHALAGYAAQELGEYARADSAFTAALAELPEKERCSWMDMSLLLDGKAHGRYKRLDCAARDSMASAVWRLVQPLYLTGVNDLRTEFLARVTRMHVEEDSRIPMGYTPGADDRETLLRYGGGLWYTQEDPPPGSARPSIVASHRRGPAFNFFPQPRALNALDQLGLDDWAFSGLAPRTHYAPEYAQRFVHLLDHQVSLFRRADSALIVAAFDLSNEGAPIGGHMKAGLFAAPLENGGVAPPLGKPIETAGPSTVSTMRAPWRPMIVSLEVLDRESRFAGRARYSLKLPTAGSRLTLSDLLLYAPRDSTPRQLDDAIPLAMHSLRLTRDQPMGLYWETYGARGRGESFDFSLVVAPVGQNWLRRAFDKLRREEKSMIAVSWREVPTVQDGIAPRAMSLNLSLLKPGRYRVQLTLTPTGDTPIVTERDIEILK